MNKLLEVQEKYIFSDENSAESFVEELKQNQEFELIDRKLTLKETKDSVFYILVVKKRFLTLSDGKQALGV